MYEVPILSPSSQQYAEPSQSSKWKDSPQAQLVTHYDCNYCNYAEAPAMSLSVLGESDLDNAHVY